MPPALSDQEKSDTEVELEVPLRSKRSTSKGKDSVGYSTDSSAKKNGDVDVKKTRGKKGKAKEEEEEDEEVQEEGEDEAEEDEYIVEKIILHSVDVQGNITFKVKWEGYEDEADQTWEPEENLLDGAPDIVAEYYRQIGSRELLLEQAQEARKNRKRGRASTGATPSSSSKRARKNGKHPADSTPPASAKANAWKPPSGSWEDEVETIDACEDEQTGKLIVYLNWKNGQKTKHGTDVIYKRCPQKMLQFYERHIRIVKTAPDAVPDAE
ncbi:hypothetical protein SODALDRAFT_345920 [Sodiomyces alkalinus F11]|uniref:Chromo domain-containing protein n=1 Tax=Sodiomyces alkalinus (strain CBS 110278 / VKM F-3762 / F11) TaxID=1314773 RepID=A0A3N2PQ32_SODAK|nr:hypothetical protein SODALDRAFT_345920 [Sodiomyces alkalinus F11]ROT36617.1 hypothetical protein SODALDRAFT_345920 [Sodiomyces alkalinus F11]